MSAPRVPLRTRVRRGVRSAILSVLVPTASRLAGRLGWSRAQRLGAGFGRVFWRLAGTARRDTLTHLAIAFPQLTDEERRDLAVRCFRHLGANLGEVLHLMARGRAALDGLLEIEGGNHVVDQLDAGRPVLVISGHLGNWELVATAFRRLGVDAWLIARDAKEGWLQDLVVALRSDLGARFVTRGSAGAPRALLRGLRGGGRSVLVLLVDQDIDVPGVFVPFFGRPAWTPRGPAELAHRFGASVIPAFDERLPDGRHKATFRAPLRLPDDVEAATAVMSEEIEREIRTRPEQWVWLHKRWRRQPADRGAE